MPRPELWYPITGYEGWYEVSDMGRVRSVDRLVVFRNGTGKRFYQGQILKQRIGTHGYPMVNLNKNKVMHEYLVHRLVMENFTLHPRNRTWINHKNGDKTDNCITNLEWCTPGENIEHAKRTGLMTVNIEGILRVTREHMKAVAMIVDNAVIRTADNAGYLAESLIEDGTFPNAKHDSLQRMIRKCANSGQPYHGYYFAFT